jgi:hypothetical protein
LDAILASFAPQTIACSFFLENVVAALLLTMKVRQKIGLDVRRSIAACREALLSELHCLETKPERQKILAILRKTIRIRIPRSILFSRLFILVCVLQLVIVMAKDKGVWKFTHRNPSTRTLPFRPSTS